MDTPKMNPVIIKLIYKVLTDPTNCYSFTNKDRRAFDDNDKDIANVQLEKIFEEIYAWMHVLGCVCSCDICTNSLSTDWRVHHLDDHNVSAIVCTECHDTKESEWGEDVGHIARRIQDRDYYDDDYDYDDYKYEDYKDRCQQCGEDCGSSVCRSCRREIR
jgi:hypothetical protein